MYKCIKYESMHLLPFKLIYTNLLVDIMKEHFFIYNVIFFGSRETIFLISLFSENM